MSTEQEPTGGQLRDAMKRIEQLMLSGLDHGYFNFTISGETVNGGKRRLIVSAGKSYQFTIPEHDLPR